MNRKKLLINILVFLCLVFWGIASCNVEYITKVLPNGLKEWIWNTPFWIVLLIQVIFVVSWFFYVYRSKSMNTKVYSFVAFIFSASAMMLLYSLLTKYNFLILISMLVWLIVRFWEERKNISLREQKNMTKREGKK